MVQIYFIVLLLLSCERTLRAQTSFQEKNTQKTLVSQFSIPQTALSVDIGSNKIATLHNGDFGNYPNIRTLYLARNVISTVESGAFAGLTSLLKLYLIANQLSTFPDVSDLPALKELYLGGNKFSGTLPTNIATAPNNNIEILNLNFQDITHIPAGFLQHFPNLKDLQVISNKLVSVPEVSVLASSLEAMDISSNSIVEVKKSSFVGNTPSVLKLLRMGNGHDPSMSTALESGLFYELPNLEKLTLHYFGLSDFPDLSRNIGKLTELTITQDTKIKTINPTKLYGDPPNYNQQVPLTKLVLFSNGIEQIDGEVLAAMTNLQTLNLLGNKLTSFPMHDLSHLDKLNYIVLESNQLTTVCDIGHRGRVGMRIAMTGNPLVCDERLCWLFEAGYAYYNPGRIISHYSEYACHEPTDKTPIKWPEFTAQSLGCSGNTVTTCSDDEDPNGDQDQDDPNDPQVTGDQSDPDDPEDLDDGRDDPSDQDSPNVTHDQNDNGDLNDGRDTTGDPNTDPNTDPNNENENKNNVNNGHRKEPHIMLVMCHVALIICVLQLNLSFKTTLL